LAPKGFVVINSSYSFDWKLLYHIVLPLSESSRLCRLYDHFVLTTVIGSSCDVKGDERVLVSKCSSSSHSASHQEDPHKPRCIWRPENM